jgi:BCD family chlorophyll transporter-like MFS transporter
MTLAEKSGQVEPEFSAPRSVKLGSFHIGSSMADLLTSAVWNRVMIVDLGVIAWPVALLSALRYLMAPLTLWAGHRSDTHPILGSRRTAYIWLGRLLMLISLPLLPISTVAISKSGTSAFGWGLAVVSFTVYGVGTLVSGAPFLALVHDSAPYARRGQTIAIVQIILVVSFAFVPAVYARLMPIYNPPSFIRLVLFGVVGAAFFWLFSVWGEERPVSSTEQRQESQSFQETFAALWAEARTRRYALFLGASAFFAFMQDAVLEPFGGDVFGLEAGETTRFNAYWGMGVLVSMIGTVFVTRRWRPEQQTSTTHLGLALLGAALSLLCIVSLRENLSAVMPVLFAFGFGFGIFTVGGVSLLMAMSVEEQAASYLALWSVVQLVARGAGIAAGGLIRDIAFTASGALPVAYAAVFLIEALGIFASIGLLLRVDVKGFATEHSSPQDITGHERAVHSLTHSE